MPNCIHINILRQNKKSCSTNRCYSRLIKKMNDWINYVNSCDQDNWIKYSALKRTLFYKEQIRGIFLFSVNKFLKQKLICCYLSKELLQQPTGYYSTPKITIKIDCEGKVRVTDKTLYCKCDNKWLQGHFVDIFVIHNNNRIGMFSDYIN